MKDSLGTKVLDSCEEMHFSWEVRSHGSEFPDSARPSLHVLKGFFSLLWTEARRSSMQLVPRGSSTPFVQMLRGLAGEIMGGSSSPPSLKQGTEIGRC